MILLRRNLDQPEKEVKYLNRLLNFISLLAWGGAFAVLIWQGWGWLSTGVWKSIGVHQAFSSLFGFIPIGKGFYPIIIIGVIMQQSLALSLALLGGACNGLAKIIER